ncbi:MAG: succinyl-diaminopimelate desuccinylase [Halieaceae bacterium MED-G27]|jgi:succinyl-diaminopimelate desuccinylase|nr:succinyl-diaminopimelate desuccinylase [Halieaceae bacterium]OUT64221.1 MAG: succinyl-diaminopimelate desuccinylase [Cellvibrionales bacterium TMED21]PDH38064.1 MAG: succinyl-diaminopimelate desuccinylase [Halieaceae bacterium MED-G27]|tara:strand:+ start:19262 stop:20410 length:1149 start_codon:yes stop_codon:yes gene_type:complete
MTTTDLSQPSIELTKTLIARPSVTPDDRGCQDIMSERLQRLGFQCEQLDCGGVQNLWATWGSSGPMLVFAGHTDVVPSGPPEHWESDPFEPTIRGDYLFGRGAADMKSSLAAMIVATERLLADAPPPCGQIGFLITSDEEGPAEHGTRYVVEELQKRGVDIDWCIVGEPSSSDVLGDTIKNGRRGSINARLVIKGKQGHVAYPHLADNPMHRAFAALDALTKVAWDQGNDHFDATSLQFSNIQSGTGASNVIPGELVADFNLRFSTEITADQIKERCENLLREHAIDFEITWRLSGNPFLTQPGALVSACQDSILEHTGVTTELSTGGGTSDGRFIATTGCQIVELGVVNRSIHQRNEHVLISDIPRLTAIYQAVMHRLLAD